MFEDDADEEDEGPKPAFCSETAALGAVVSVEQAAIPATEAAQRAVSVRFIFVSSGILRLTESVDGTGITEVKLSRRLCDNRAIQTNDSVCRAAELGGFSGAPCTDLMLAGS